MKAMFSIPAILLLGGCVSAGRRIDMEKVEKVEIGKTTRAEVLELLGSPDNITRSGRLEVLGYFFMRATPSGVNFVPIVGAFAGGGKAQTQIVQVTISPEGVVTDVLSSVGGSEAGYGAMANPRADLPEVEEDKRPE